MDNFWPWVANKNGPNSKYYGTQHFRAGNNIAAPRDGVPIDVNDAATDTIPVSEDAAIPDTPRKFLGYLYFVFSSLLTYFIFEIIS